MSLNKVQEFLNQIISFLLLSHFIS